MYEVAATTTIRRPIGEVFDYIATIANWPVIDPMEAVENPPDHPTRQGETFVVLFKLGPFQMTTDWTVAESVPPQRWVGDMVARKRIGILDSGASRMTYSLVGTADGTRVELRYSWTPRNLARFVELALPRGL